MWQKIKNFFIWEIYTNVKPFYVPQFDVILTFFTRQTSLLFSRALRHTGTWGCKEGFVVTRDDSVHTHIKPQKSIILILGLNTNARYLLNR